MNEDWYAALQANEDAQSIFTAVPERLPFLRTLRQLLLAVDLTAPDALHQLQAVVASLLAYETRAALDAERCWRTREEA